MDIAQLIDRAVRELENTSRSSDMVGNQPCYPMYLAVSSKEFQAAGHRFRRKLGRAWPQAIGFGASGYPDRGPSRASGYAAAPGSD